MPRSRTFLPIVGLLMVIVVTGFIVWFFSIGSADESRARTLLANEGALVVMNPDGRNVGTVSLSTIQDETKQTEALNIAAALQSLKSLDLNGTGIDNADLETISALTSLVSLSLKSTEIDDAGLDHIAKLTNLESLHLNDTAITDAGLASLTALGNLKVLDLSGTRIKNDLTPLAKLGNLEWLVLGGLSLGESSLAVLADLPRLKRLTLRGSTYPESAVEQLSTKRRELRIDQ